LSSIQSNFNGTAIAPGSTLWFSSAMKVNGLGSSPVTLHVTNQTIDFSVNDSAVVLNVPDSTITLSPTATTATTSFDAASNSWVTTLPFHFSGNAFLGGVADAVANGLPGGINPVTWNAQFTTDTAGVSINWQWATAVYTLFSTNYNALNLKPVDDNHVSQYQNSDPAGTPEAFTAFVTGGARGGGGSNYTGSLSATASIVPLLAQPPATVSGYVFTVDASGHVLGVLVGAELVLNGTTTAGQTVTMTTFTNANGFYSFTGLQAGSYTISQENLGNYVEKSASVGTVNGSTDGTVQSGALAGVSLALGNNGVNYNFFDTFGGS
jgi:hypothetical protein